DLGIYASRHAHHLLAICRVLGVELLQVTLGIQIGYERITLAELGRAEIAAVAHDLFRALHLPLNGEARALRRGLSVRVEQHNRREQQRQADGMRHETTPWNETRARRLRSPRRGIS